MIRQKVTVNLYDHDGDTIREFDGEVFSIGGMVEGGISVNLNATEDQRRGPYQTEITIDEATLARLGFIRVGLPTALAPDEFPY